MQNKVDPAALMLAVLVVVFAPFTTDGLWSLINTLSAAVVLTLVLVFTWPRYPAKIPEAIPLNSVVWVQSIVYGLVVAVFFAWPVQQILFLTVNSEQAEYLRKSPSPETYFDVAFVSQQAAAGGGVLGMLAVLIFAYFMFRKCRKLRVQLAEYQRKNPPVHNDVDNSKRTTNETTIYGPDFSKPQVFWLGVGPKKLHLKIRLELKAEGIAAPRSQQDI